MRKVLSIISAVALVASINFATNPSFATQKQVNDLAATPSKSDKSQGVNSATPSNKPEASAAGKVAAGNSSTTPATKPATKAEVSAAGKVAAGNSSVTPTSSAGNGNSSSNKPAPKLKSPKEITFSNITISSFKVYWQPVENSADYRIRVYPESGHETVFEGNVGSTTTEFTVGGNVELSQPSYRVSVQALPGNNSNYLNSPESGKFEVIIPICEIGGQTVGIAKICGVGDTGPGGGIIFHYDANGFNCGPSFSATGSPTGGLCHYLEAAPIFWFSLDSVDPNARWSTIMSAVQSPGSRENSAGSGLRNSLAAIAQFGQTPPAATTDSAALLANNYRGKGFQDWYLPSEIEQAWVWNNLSSMGRNNDQTCVWTSTEVNDGGARYQDYYRGSFGESNKQTYCRVIPIRAF